MTLAPDSLGPTVCIGEILAEIVATTVGAGFSEPLSLIGPYPSGAPAIFIDQCGRFGGSAAMIGAVGDDDFGRMNIGRLRRDGVDVSGIGVDPELPTGTAFVRYRPDGDRDFVFNMWTSAAGRLVWTDAMDAIVSRAGHLHVMGTLLGNSTVWPMIERAAEIISRRGGSISLDPNMRKELQADTETGARVAAMVAMSDLLLPSGDELFVAAGLSPDVGEEVALKHLFGTGVSEIAIKRGGDGSSCHEADGTLTRVPAFIVEEIDPTGAGDCFGGAYVAARRLGMSAQQSLTYANAAGARNVMFRGPMEGAGTRAELDTFIQQMERAK
ncbi:fructokinase [Celeribacter baekdonensis]|uniref:Fructokinase n=1 Tax=Celeribacter baekdonensis TaxID=875171 RepID=A0A1G7QSD1_9RHOB|nr:sugar kinase [Celeribacter baekdonensis]SDG01422.1 fructokinase [Celeribacter baekdonensis]